MTVSKRGFRFCEHTTLVIASTIILVSSPYRAPRAANNDGSIKIAVIVNPKATTGSLTKQEIKRLFLKQQQDLGGTTARPLDLMGEPQIRKAFLKAVLGMSEAQYARYWIKKRYVAGKSAPAKLPSAAEVIALVEVMKGAIGFVDAKAIPPSANVKVIASFVHAQ